MGLIMVQAGIQTIDFDTFVAMYPEQGQRYELHDGLIIEMPKPTGYHSQLTGFLIEELIWAIAQMGKRGQWLIPRESIVRAANGRSGYEPDILVLERSGLAQEERWARESVIEGAAAVRLVVEVVSQNWRDDYFKKRADYEELGIQEYWIVDYAALGGRTFLGNPKIPTLFVHELIDGEYQITPFRHQDLIISPTFPELTLTVDRLWAAADPS